MRKVFLSLLVMLSPIPTYAENFQIKNGIKDYKVEIIGQDDKGIDIRFELGNFSRQSQPINGQVYHQIKLEGASYLQKKSFPELPKIIIPLALPSSENIQLEILDSKYELLKLGIPVPSKGDFERNTNPVNVPYTFSEIYNQKYTATSTLPFPEKFIKASHSYALRGVTGVNLTVHPLQFLPSSKLFKVYSSIEIRLSFKQAENRTLSHPFDSNFETLFKSRFSNWKQQKRLLSGEIKQLDSPKGKILIVAGDQFVNSDLQGFAMWKRQLGFKVKLVKMSDTGANSQDLKQYIQEEYNLDPLLAYVILVGDAEHVPFYKGTAGNARNNEADPMYGLVVGDDSYPDIIVARISVKNSEELRNILSKSIEYEKNPKEGEWFRSALGIASDDGSPTDGTRADKLKNVLLDSDKYDYVESLYDPGVEASHITEAINAGHSLINYIGHGYETAWVTGYFKNSHIDKLDNGAMLPVIISVACVNGRFSYESKDSFAEKWIKAGEVGKPKGAIAIFASSTNQSWVPPTIGQLAISKLASSDEVFSIGSLMMNGSIAVLQDGSYSAKQTFQTWHIFGDPTIEFRSDIPEPIQETLLDTDLPWGEAYFVSEPGLRFSITDGSSLVHTQVSDEDGMIMLPGMSLLKGKKALKITVSGNNKIPVIKSFRELVN